jgi:hypothetical protein
MSNDIVGWNSLKQLDGVVGGEVVNFFFNFADDFQVRFEKLKLNVNI